jgi:hypothetical protein
MIGEIVGGKMCTAIVAISFYGPLPDRIIFSRLRRREEPMTIAHKTNAPHMQFRENDHEAISITRILTPNGIPIIKPNPIKNEGAIAISGL